MLMAPTLLGCLEALYKCNYILSILGIGTFGNSDITFFD